MIPVSLRSAAALLLAGFLGSCSTTDPAAAPARDGFSGALLGGTIGSLSGDTAAGALLGGALGLSLGEMTAEDRDGPPAALVLDAVPDTLRDAAGKDLAWRKEYATLYSRCQQAKARGDRQGLMIVNAMASRYEGEAKIWRDQMARQNAVMDRALAGKIHPGSRGVRKIADDRRRSASLQTAFSRHADQFRSLARYSS